MSGGPRSSTSRRPGRHARGERETPRSRSRIAPQELLRRAAAIRLVLLDVDGVMTDGRIWYGPEGEALKAFDVRDGHGIVLLRDHVDFGVISGRPGKATERRLAELRFKHAVFGQRDKLAAYAQLAALGVADAQVAYMGDDVNDLGLLARVGLSACPADARPEVRERVHFVTGGRGGRGAVRELCDLILKAKGIAVP
ncbi:MAG TPA: HAD hydrolase family protein [Anaeromyxobacteraceae bacterium]|nr:HAD hydrolase family protein [Anaeromyxobacteraceae bacterium]